ncbi:MAG: hypothetical protein ABI898_02555 [Sphingomonadales bacterium]
MGPSLLFDKSFLQSLSVDEAAVLDQMFSCVVSPLFFAETMADLAKEPKGGRAPAQIVGELAARTPVAHSYMNAFHSRLIMDELFGGIVSMERRPVVAGGVPVRVEGKIGVVYKKSPEAEAFERWQRGRFLEVEHIAAQVWRSALVDLDLPGIARAFKAMLRKEARPRNHSEAQILAQAIIDSPGQSYKTLTIAHGLLGMPPESLPGAIETWRRAGSMPLRKHAPFAAHCLEIDLYFYLALSNGIISDQRPSNRIDIAYLYYLPFTDLFVSSDRLHRTTAALFIGEKQRFVWGPDLKQDLLAINQHLLALPEEERRKGLFLLADCPPVDSDGLCATLWDEFRHDWRKPKRRLPELTPEQHREIIRSGDRLRAAADKPSKLPPEFPMPSNDGIDNLILERHIPQVRGSWRMFSKEIEDAEQLRK